MKGMSSIRADPVATQDKLVELEGMEDIVSNLNNYLHICLR